MLDSLKPKFNTSFIAFRNLSKSGWDTSIIRQFMVSKMYLSYALRMILEVPLDLLFAHTSQQLG